MCKTHWIQAQQLDCSTKELLGLRPPQPATAARPCLNCLSTVNLSLCVLLSTIPPFIRPFLQHHIPNTFLPSTLKSHLLLIPSPAASPAATQRPTGPCLSAESAGAEACGPIYRRVSRGVTSRMWVLDRAGRHVAGLPHLPPSLRCLP